MESPSAYPVVNNRSSNPSGKPRERGYEYATVVRQQYYVSPSLIEMHLFIEGLPKRRRVGALQNCANLMNVLVSIRLTLIAEQTLDREDRTHFANT